MHEPFAPPGGTHRGVGRSAPSWGIPGRARSLFEPLQANIIHAAHEAIITVDEHQRIVMINPAAQRMFGCAAGEALGSSLSRFIPPSYRVAHAAQVRRFDESGTVERPMGQRSSVTGLRSNGQEFPVEAIISRLDVIGEMGPRRYFTALLRDLSEVRNLKAELDAVGARMRSIFDLAPLAIWITSGDEIVFANRACATLFGAADRDSLVGRSIYTLLEPRSHASVQGKLRQVLEGTAVSVVRERIVRLDGVERDIEIALAALHDDGQTTVQMIIRDVTEVARERAEFEESRRELRRLSASQVDAREEERRRIARELHDELGQRLTALKMELSSLAAPNASSRLKEGLAAALVMVDDTVASVRRIATDLRPLMLDDLGLNAAIEWLARESARRMGLEVQLQLGPSDPPIDNASAIALYRMVQEALTNIARHAQATEVRIGVQQEGDELLLTVQDNGVGFPEASIYREGAHGLLGIRERADMLGGRLEVGDAPSGGARVSVRLPIVSAAKPRSTGSGGDAALGLATREDREPGP